jgi:diguanylate cyclase (GGDEF)-like protein
MPDAAAADRTAPPDDGPAGTPPDDGPAGTAPEPGPGRAMDPARELVAAAMAPLALVDADGLVVLGNQAFADLSRHAAASLRGLPASQLLPLAPGPEGLAHTLALARAGRPVPNCERVYVDELGNRRRIRWLFSPGASSPGASSPGASSPGASSPGASVGAAHLVATGVDVTEHRLTEASLRQRAETDALTGVANRVALDAVLGSHLDPERGTGCGLLFCDLDRFKQVNDTYGHQVGDEVLIQVARRLMRAVRQGDVVARIGGDEFVVILPAAGLIEVRALAARIERNVASPVRTSAGMAQVGVSIGQQVADPGDDPAQVLRAADQAMYAVKTRRDHGAGPDTPRPSPR